MASILIFFLLLSSILMSAKPTEITYITSYCPNNTTTNYTEGSKFQFNLNRLLYRLLYNNGGNSTYAKPSVGENNDKVHGLHLCRGDVALKDCQNCIDMASERIQRECPLKKQAIIWYDHCLIRYSDSPFASTFNVSSYYWIVYSTQSFSLTEQIEGISDAMFDNLTPKATNDLKYAESLDEIPPLLSLSQKLYGMVQCIPDLSAADCHACLKGARSVIPKSVPRECRVVHESCHLSYQFKNPDGGKMRAPPPSSPEPPPPSSPEPPPPSSPEPGDKDKGGITWKIKLICIIIGVIALLSVVLSGFCLYLMKRRRQTQRERNERSRLIQWLGTEGNIVDEF